MWAVYYILIFKCNTFKFQLKLFNYCFCHRYILSLALADLLVIVTSVPFVSIVYTIDSWPWGEYICVISEFVKDVSIGVSVFTLTALSSDRFFAIVDPLRKFHAHGKFFLKKNFLHRLFRAKHY